MIPKGKGSGKLSVQSSLGSNPDDEDDDAIGAAFLGVNRNYVKTAHEPKPPKDYVDSSKDVISAVDKQKAAKVEVNANKKKKGPIRHGPTISVGGDEIDDDSKEKEAKSDDKNKKKDDDNNNNNDKNNNNNNDNDKSKTSDK